MALPNQKFREVVFLLLYSYDMGKTDPKDQIPMIMNELAVTRKAVLIGKETVDRLILSIDDIDAMIGAASKEYSFDRIQSVERNILRLALFEMLYDKNVPPKVAIAEAIRLAKKFSTPESISFVNAVLDRIYKEHDNSDNEKSDIH